MVLGICRGLHDFFVNKVFWGHTTTGGLQAVCFLLIGFPFCFMTIWFGQRAESNFVCNSTTLNGFMKSKCFAYYQEENWDPFTSTILLPLLAFGIPIVLWTISWLVTKVTYKNHVKNGAEHELCCGYSFHMDHCYFFFLLVRLIVFLAMAVCGISYSSGWDISSEFKCLTPTVTCNFHSAEDISLERKFGFGFNVVFLAAALLELILICKKKYSQKDPSDAEQPLIGIEKSCRRCEKFSRFLNISLEDEEHGGGNRVESHTNPAKLKNLDTCNNAQASDAETHGQLCTDQVNFAGSSTRRDKITNTSSEGEERYSGIPHSNLQQHEEGINNPISHPDGEFPPQPTVELKNLDTCKYVQAGDVETHGQSYADLVNSAGSFTPQGATSKTSTECEERYSGMPPSNPPQLKENGEILPQSMDQLKTLDTTNNVQESDAETNGQSYADLGNVAGSSNLQGAASNTSSECEERYSGMPPSNPPQPKEDGEILPQSMDQAEAYNTARAVANNTACKTALGDQKKTESLKMTYLAANEEALRTRPSRRVRLMIAQKLEAWKTLGYYLGVPDHAIHDIDGDYNRSIDKKYQLINAWMEQSKEVPTLGLLIGGLRAMGNQFHIIKDINNITENNRNAGPEFQKEPPPGVKRLVMNTINADWRRLALYLDLDEHIIESIECDHSSVHDRSWEVLKCWMRREPTGTLGDLMACLDTMGRRQLVRDIMKETNLVWEFQ